MSNENLLQSVEKYYINPIQDKKEIGALLKEFFSALERGEIRAAFKSRDGDWCVEPRVKLGILLAFRHGEKSQKNIGMFNFIDKDNLWPREFSLRDNVRIVAGGASVRQGAYLGKNVIIMPPSFINIGAFVDEGSLIDSNALVGSCAQVGKNVHVSAGVQIGGVLEPIGSLPVIIEDDVLLGGQSGLFEGVIVKSRAVIGAGVILTSSSKVYDLVNEKIILADEKTKILTVPQNAVVIPGSRDIQTPFGKKHGLSISAPIIIKYRDEKTDSKAELEEALRFG